MREVKLSNAVWHVDLSMPVGEPGGFGAVYKGAAISGRKVAVKRLFLDAKAAAHRELRNIEHLLKQELKHVVPLLDAGQDTETEEYFIVMELADQNLAQYLSVHSPLSEAEALGIADQIASGLREIGDLVHRDIKPENVLFHDGVWKISDFGISRFVEAATSTNTMQQYLSAPYAAPEQWLGIRATKATDLYALGCVIFELLREKPPFGHDTRDVLRDQHLTKPPPLDEIASDRLRALVGMMLRKSAETRPTIERVVSFLSELRSPKSVPKSGRDRLAKTGAKEIERLHQVEAEQRRKAERIQHLNKLSIPAVRKLIEISDQLFNQIELRIPYQRGGRGFPIKRKLFGFENTEGKLLNQIGMDDAYLTMWIFGENGCISAEAVVDSTPEVIAAGGIKVENQKVSRSASLLFANFHNQEQFRWYEATFCVAKGTLAALAGLQYGEKDGQFALDPDTLSMVRWNGAESFPLGAYDVVTGPTPIDDENVDHFIERWMETLAQAIEKELKNPDPPGA